MSEVAKLAVVPIDRTGRPQSEVIAFLEAILARAETGEIQSIAVAYALASGHGGTGSRYGERPGDCYAVGTALMCLQHDFVCEIEQSARSLEEPTLPPAG